MRSDTGPFAMVPDWLLELGLSSRAIHLYAVLSRFADKGGVAFPLRETLSEKLSSSKKSVDRATAELKAAEAISVQSRKDKQGQRSNLYTVHRVQPRGSILSPPLVTGVSPPSSPVSPITRTNEREPLTTCEQSSREGSTHKPRPPDPLWDALVLVFQCQPATKTERGKWNAACGQLRAAGATESQVRARAGTWKLKFPGATLTPMALAAHWGALAPPVTPQVTRLVTEEGPPPDFVSNTANLRAIREQMRL